MGEKATKVKKFDYIRSCFRSTKVKKFDYTPSCFRAPKLGKSKTTNEAAVHPPFRSSGQYPLYSQIELSLSSNLKECGSHLLAVIFLVDKDENFDEIGRTEVASAPIWIEKITVPFQFEALQTLVFRLFHVSDVYRNLPVKTLNLTKLTYLGEATCILSEIITTPGRSVTLQLLAESTNVGTLSLQAEETIASKTVVNMTLGSENLDSKSNYFLIISRLIRDNTTIAIPVYVTEVVKNNPNPIWKPICLTVQHFERKETSLLLECIDYKTSERIGMTVKSVSQLESLFQQKEAALFVYPSTTHGRNKVLKGQLNVDAFEKKVQDSFLDYISSGFKIGYMAAVDFSASSGDYRTATSLHHDSPLNGLNPYQQAIMGVGEVLQFYDSNENFLAWGFGRMKEDGNESHCFELTRDNESSGLEGIMSAYANTRTSVVPAKTTRLSDVIEKAIGIASHARSQNIRKYFVLQIVTGDGACLDIADTIDALVRASTLPLSVLVVGVGNANFTHMERALNADLRSSTTRDMVQFVPVQEGLSGQVSLMQALFALPDQFMSYFRSLGSPQI
ncbi:C2 domain-containing protein [Hirschfeldia incana]|nr:C2 domain-containing protein [Hirschfeldia incana]